MVKFWSFSMLKDIFSRLNPLNSFDLEDIDVEIDKVPTSDELLQNIIKKYSNFEKVILTAIYHLINTQNVNNEYLTILTKKLRLICDLVEGTNGEVRIPDYVTNEPVNNIFLTCHNHFHNAILPSSKDFKNVIKPMIKFTVIVSDDNIGIIVNELCENFYSLSKLEKKELKNTWKTFKDFIIFCMASDFPEIIFKFYNDEYSDEEFQFFFEKYVGVNIQKFVDEFNARFKKYKIYYVYIKL